MNAQPKRERVTQFTPSTGTPAPTDMTVLNNEKAERAVLGAVFQRPDLFPTLSHLLQPVDFWSLFYGLCWYVVDKMVANGDNVNIVTIADAIEQEKSNPYKGDGDALVNALSSLYGACPDVDHAEDFAHQVREAALVCRVVKSLDKTKADILKGDLRGEELKDELNRRMFEATEQSVERKSDASSMMTDFIDGFEGGALASTVPTGFHHLDNLLSGFGFFPGEVCVWAGSAGMGKTTALLSIARNVARSQRSVALFTMEMEQPEIAQALIAMETGIPRKAIQSKRLSPVQYEKLIEAAGNIGAWDMHTVDMHEFPSLKPLQLKRKLRSLMVNNPIDMVILDGLWLMQPNEPNPNRFEAVGAIMRDLSGIAKQFNVPILLAHQYKEGMSKEKKPRLDMLAESSGVQRNAQVVIGMWRSSYFKDDASSDTYAHVLKNRNRGMIGSAPIPYNVKYNRFGDEYE
jgi:replicative DNA helicase